MKKFEIGKEYFDRSACNYDCIFTMFAVKVIAFPKDNSRCV